MKMPAITYLKRRGVTHVKLELEADLNRREGYEPEGEECVYCFGSGTVNHDCEQEGHDTCWNDGDEVECDNCDGRGYLPSESREHPYMSNEYCQTFILNAISPELRNNITFSRFYRDGSVDSEFTVTIPVDMIPRSPELLEAFRKLGDLTGTFDTTNAGMHLALLWSGTYPVTSVYLNTAYIENFKREMNKLMPALFFLGSHNHISRPLNFRNPRVSDDKYSAIHLFHTSRGYQGAMEFRVFETCYDRPDAIINHFGVMAQSLQYYGTKKVDKPTFSKFDFVESQSRTVGYLARFYQTVDAVDALDKSLEYLLPQGVTPAKAKAERRFRAGATPAYADRKLIKQYIDEMASRREQIEAEVKRGLKYYLRNGIYEYYDPSYGEFKIIRKSHNVSMKEVAGRIRASVERQADRIMTFPQWKANHLRYQRNITITA